MKSKDWPEWIDLKQCNIQVRHHPFSTPAKFSEKLTFLIPWYAQIRVRIRGLEMLVSRKICVHTKWMIP